MPPPQAPRPGLAPRPNEPATPEGLELSGLPRGVRAELRGLPPELADIVGAHLVMAGRLLDTDPERAFEHAEAAKRRASRLPVVREAAATTAYAAGRFADALQEYRVLRRMTGSDELFALMADCERGVGRPQAALKLVQEGLATQPAVAERVELRLVEAGARADLGQSDEARRLLRNDIELIGARGPRSARARLRFLYADLLQAAGDTEGALAWFEAAARLDPEDATGAQERINALHGLTIEFDETDETDDDGTTEQSDDQASADRSGQTEPADQVDEDGAANGAPDDE